MKRAWSSLFVLMGVIGCAPIDDASVEAQSIPLEDPTPFNPELIYAFDAERRATAAEIAQAKVERAQDACGPCRSRACRMLCILGEDYERAAERPQGDEDDCLMCGRETGFLPRPDLRYEIVAPGRVAFDWDPVDGADEYALIGMRWQDDTMTSMWSFEERTPAHRYEIQLETGAGYTFYLTAHADEGGQRSLPSEPLDFEL